MSYVIEKKHNEFTNLKILFNHSKFLEEFNGLSKQYEQASCEGELEALEDILLDYEDIWLEDVLESLATVSNPSFKGCRSIAQSILKNDTCKRNFVSAVQKI